MPADIIDKANDTADHLLRVSLRNQKHGARKPTPGIGVCLSCGADVEGERRWCDVDCRNDWESAQRRR